MREETVDFSTLLGKVMVSVEGGKGSNEIVFTTDDGKVYTLSHDQDCCESVYIEDIEGDLIALVGKGIVRGLFPIEMAEEVSNVDLPPADGADSSYTWTFYKLATFLGYVTIRFFGTSNGYYGETASLKRIK